MAMEKLRVGYGRSYRNCRISRISSCFSRISSCFSHNLDLPRSAIPSALAVLATSLDVIWTVLTISLAVIWTFLGYPPPSPSFFSTMPTLSALLFLLRLILSALPVFLFRLSNHFSDPL